MLHVYVQRDEITYPVVNGAKEKKIQQTRYEVAPCK